MKLDLYRLLYGGSFRALEDKFGWYKSNYGEALGWIKYKSEGFHKQYLISFDEEKRFVATLSPLCPDNNVLGLKSQLNTIPVKLCILLI